MEWNLYMQYIKAIPKIENSNMAASYSRKTTEA